MELKDALLRRRSIRKFTNQPVSDEMIHHLLQAAMSGPSACNKCPWEFYVITDEGALEGLRGATHFARMIAPLSIVVCGNLNRALPQQLASYWIQDCSAATQNILLQATALGLGAVWCGVHPQIRGEAAVREVLGLDESIVPLNIIHIGHPAEEAEPRTQFDENRVHYVR